MEYEIIVVGGGHAGCEAALAGARIGHKTLLVTGNINNVATMPCNPSIGGSAKGIIVREIDALGGEMGINADKTLIQMKMLNCSKGPAVKSLRAQADKVTYPQEMLKTMKLQVNLDLLEGIAEDLIVEDNIVKGVILGDGRKITANCVILTTGTYLKSDILIGSTRTRSGPHGEKPSMHLSDNLKKYGFDILRLKTGTPPRIQRDTIDFSKTKLEEGDKEYYTFSHDIAPIYDINNQEIKDNQNFIYIGGIAQYIFPYDKFTNYDTNQYINLWLQTPWQLSNKKTKKLIQTLGSISLDKKSNKL